MKKNISVLTQSKNKFNSSDSIVHHCTHTVPARMQCSITGLGFVRLLMAQINCTRLHDFCCIFTKQLCKDLMIHPCSSRIIKGTASLTLLSQAHNFLHTWFHFVSTLTQHQALLWCYRSVCFLVWQ